MVGTGKLTCVLWCKFLDIWFVVHLTINIFSFYFGRFQVKLHFLRNKPKKCSHLVHFGYCHYVIKYLMRDMMNYHCLRVFGRRVRRIGKHSPVFSVLGTRVHGCSDAELCCVPIQSTFVEIVPFDN